MGRHAGRIDFHIVARPVPEISRAGKQFMRLKGCVPDTHLLERKLQISGVPVPRIEIHHRHDQVRAVIATACCTQSIDRCRSDETEATNRSAAPGSPCESGSQCDEFAADCRADRIPSCSKLIFLRIEIFFASGVPGGALHQLECGSVDAIVRSERRSENSRIMNPGRPVVCRNSVRMSGVFGQWFGRKYSLTFVCVSSVKYAVSSCLVCRQGKYVYDWLKPSFRKPIHHLWPRERFGKKEHLGMTAL